MRKATKASYLPGPAGFMDSILHCDKATRTCIRDEGLQVEDSILPQARLARLFRAR